jgi:hypothetical protein
LGEYAALGPEWAGLSLYGGGLFGELCGLLLRAFLCGAQCLDVLCEFGSPAPGEASEGVEFVFGACAVRCCGHRACGVAAPFGVQAVGFGDRRAVAAELFEVCVDGGHVWSAIGGQFCGASRGVGFGGVSFGGQACRFALFGFGEPAQGVVGQCAVWAG